jgi:hypothetical protein
MTTLDDELLKKIATGSGRTYPHEGKAMAEELIRRRAAEKAAATPPPTPTGYGGMPYP